MMFYYIIKFYTKIVFSLYYRKIYVDGLENIPKNRPVLLCSNHPNGFIEPMIIGRFIPNSIYFLVRGDLFDVPVLGWFLRRSHQIPIYRKKDGFKNLKSNHSTMNWVQNALLQHKKILIFPEGGTEIAKHLRPLQKGVARMAFDFQSKQQEETLLLLPIAINFTNLFEMRSEMTISFLPNIDVSSYMDVYEDSKPKAYKSLLKDLKKAIESKMISVSDEHDLSLYEKLIPLFRQEMKKYSLRSIQKNNVVLTMEQTIVRNIKSADAETKKIWEHEIDAIVKVIGSIKNPNYAYKSTLPRIGVIILAILGFIPSIIGFIFHLLPFTISRIVANKYARNDIFWASLVVSSAIVSFTVYYIIIGVLLVNVFGSLGLILIAPFMLFGWIFIHYKEFIENIIHDYKWSRLVNASDINERIKLLKENIYKT